MRQIDELRRQTRLIIRKDGEYLVGSRMVTGGLIWSLSPWDAWGTRVRANARSVQSNTGGEICLFYPVVGQIKAIVEGGQHEGISRL